MKKTIIALLIPVLLLVFAGCQLADPKPTEQDVPAQTTPKLEVELPLTKQTAIAVALNHAGAANEDVKHLHTRLDTHTAVDHYDVDFHYGEYCYEYELNEQTGEILKFEKDHLDEDIPLKNLTIEEAKQIALELAGYTQEGVSAMEAEFNREEHYYEVDFIVDGYEYNYEICAEYGKVLDEDKEPND